jgi:hypothetical protein
MEKTENESQRDVETEKEVFKAMKRGWQNLEKREKDTGERRDKYLVTLSVGGLALSLTFLEKLVPCRITDLCYLILTWRLLVLSIMLVVIALWIDPLAFKKEVSNIRKLGESSEEIIPRNVLATASFILRTIALIALLIALVSFYLFATSNVPQSLKLTQAF